MPKQNNPANLISIKKFKEGDVIYLTDEKLYAIIKDVWEIKKFVANPEQEKNLRLQDKLFTDIYLVLDEKGKEYPVSVRHNMYKVEDEEIDRFWLRRFANA